MNNNFVPYLIIHTTKGNLKFLVDTGANKNYISPNHVNEENCKPETGIHVSNIRGKHKIEKSASFDVFQIKKKVKFYIFQFHDFFDGLIGYETLRDLNAQLNIGKNTLKIGRKTFKLEKKFSQNHKINLTEQEYQFLDLPVKRDGNFLVEEETKFEHFSILPGLYEGRNGRAMMSIRNHNPQTTLQINCNEIEIGTDYFRLKEIPKSTQTALDTEFHFRDEHLNEEEKRALKTVIDANKEVLYSDSKKLTFTHKIKHHIRTSDNIPIHTKSYKYPQIFEAEVQQQVKKMLNDGIIKESISPYTSPIWVVPKKSDASGKKKFRLVIDYRKLNEKTISDKYPIPEITDILDKLGKTCYFSTIDLVSGFHQIQLADEDTEKTAFSVSSGKYEFTRMPFGLKNAPATFQRVMDCILREFLGKCCLVYMDDIIVFSSSLEEHKKDLMKILNRLKEANLKIQLDKCEFFRKEVQYLGHTVSEEGVKPNTDKIEIIKKWPIPKNEKEIRQFLGTLGYYRRFIKDFAKLVKPLTGLLRKEADFNITPEIVECFEKCKTLLTMDPILIFPDFSKEFILTTDASDYAIGAVLSQGPVGKDRPIAYASRTLNSTEENYSTLEKEFLAIVWAVKHFRPYLYGRKFKLFTDHQPLTYSMSDANKRVVRGKVALEEFDYELIYKPGSQNTVADALSRIKPDQLNANEQAEANEQSSESDSDLETVHSAETSDDFFIWCTERPINWFKTQLIFKLGQIDAITYEEIFPKYHRFTFTKPNFTEADIVEIFKGYLNPRGISCLKIPIPLVQLVQETYRKHFTNNKFKVFVSEKILEDVRLEEQKDAIIRDTHDAAHRGIKENKMQISQNYFFPEIERKLKTFISSCHICKKSKYDRKPPKLIQKSIFGSKQFERVHIDIFFMEGQKWLTIVDSFSKFANTIPLPTRTIVDLKHALSEHIRHFGRPQTIVCDQEPGFKSIDFVGFLNELGVEIHFASNSASNGIVERFHSTLIELYRTLKSKYKELPINDRINIITDIYNNTFHSATKRKPRELIFNTLNITDAADLIEQSNKIHTAVKLELDKRKQIYEQKHENREQPTTINPNDSKYVKISQRLTKDKDVYKITTVQEDNNLTFKDTNGVKIHKNRIKN